MKHCVYECKVSTLLIFFVLFSSLFLFIYFFSYKDWESSLDWKPIFRYKSQPTQLKIFQLTL